MYVSKEKEVKFYKVPFIEQGVWLNIVVNNRHFVITKKQICWRNIRKRIKFRRYDDWVPYILILDSKAYEAMLP